LRKVFDISTTAIRHNTTVVPFTRPRQFRFGFNRWEGHATPHPVETPARVEAIAAVPDGTAGAARIPRAAPSITGESCWARARRRTRL
jgi:hypothetical protein